MKTYRAVLGAAVCAGALVPLAAAGTCHLLPVPITGSTGTLAGVSVDFGVADNAERPTAWQGPLRIKRGTAPACKVSNDVAIVEVPVMLGDGVLYVQTYSGGDNRLYAVDVHDCRVLWRSRQFNGSARFVGGTFRIAGRSLHLNPQCRPAGVATDWRQEPST